MAMTLRISVYEKKSEPLLLIFVVSFRMSTTNGIHFLPPEHQGNETKTLVMTCFPFYFEVSETIQVRALCYFKSKVLIQF